MGGFAVVAHREGELHRPHRERHRGEFGGGPDRCHYDGHVAPKQSLDRLDTLAGYLAVRFFLAECLTLGVQTHPSFHQHGQVRQPSLRLRRPGRHDEKRALGKVFCEGREHHSYATAWQASHPNRRPT